MSTMSPHRRGGGATSRSPLLSFAFFAAKFRPNLIYMTFVPFVVNCLLRLRFSRGGSTESRQQ
jgi:hypothetical protein